jgi:hypothetical protein
VVSDREWAHLGYLAACQAALEEYGVQTVGMDAGSTGMRTGSVEVLVVGRRGYLEPMDLGWSEEHGWGYSRRVDPAAEEFEHGQFGGGVLPEPAEFAARLVGIASGESGPDHVPGERRAYRSARDRDDLDERLAAYPDA